MTQLEIDFLYLDLSTCSRCIGTNANIEAALDDVGRLLHSLGVAVRVRKTLVGTEEQARQLRFVSSPTIRINGRDIAPELRESRCESCEACACNGTVNCRVWVFQGQAYLEAPRAMLIDAILRAVYGGRRAPAPEEPPFADVPENLKRFFAGKAGQAALKESVCCSTSARTTCC